MLTKVEPTHLCTTGLSLVSLTHGEFARKIFSDLFSTEPQPATRSKNTRDSKLLQQLCKEAITRRWSPSMDIPWSTVRDLPRDIECALCLVCTEFLQYANTDIALLVNRLQTINRLDSEESLFLATSVLDAARRCEAFRKRASMNAVGLGAPTRRRVCEYLREIDGSWTETIAGLSFIRGLFVLTICEYLARHAYNTAERILYSNVIQDVARLVCYSVDHIDTLYAAHARAKAKLSKNVDYGLGLLRIDIEEPTFRDSMVIIFAGARARGKANGISIYDDMIKEYTNRVQEFRTWLGVEPKTTESFEP